MRTAIMGIKPKLTPTEARADHWRMLRFMGLNAAFGVFLGLMIAALLILLDIGGIGSRIARAETPILPIILIAVPLALTFGAAVTASAIWMMPYDSKFRAENDNKPGRGEGDEDA
ncbi:hypothetical protein [Rhizobium sp. TRM95796]|uniref:hypothetical protein n=1 Tax=Rhizobium sp. TRM95796 TaxID=2979862 RepID=UPI0021E87E7D|nr:hypothetical protein [Rhizobium sp. TRM95796]MCV3767033.1 hypothetical protein [Rhizobium sp. TRM95796]